MLLKDAVPSVFLWKKHLFLRTHRSVQLKEKNLKKFEALKRKKTPSVYNCLSDHVCGDAIPIGTNKNKSILENVTLEIEVINEQPSSENKSEIVKASISNYSHRNVKIRKDTRSVSTQTPANLFSCFKYKNNPNGIAYYGP